MPTGYEVEMYRNISQIATALEKQNRILEKMTENNARDDFDEVFGLLIEVKNYLFDKSQVSGLLDDEYDILTKLTSMSVKYGKK